MQRIVFLTMHTRLSLLALSSLLLCCVLLFGISVESVAAVEILDKATVDQVKAETGLGTTSPIQVTAIAVGAFLNILGVIAFIMFIYAGFRWMTAGGRTPEVTKAKDMMKHAIVGLVIIMASYSIARYVFSIIEGATGQGAIPQQSGFELQHNQPYQRV